MLNIKTKQNKYYGKKKATVKLYTRKKITFTIAEGNKEENKLNKLQVEIKLDGVKYSLGEFQDWAYKNSLMENGDLELTTTFRRKYVYLALTASEELKKFFISKDFKIIVKYKEKMEDGSDKTLYSKDIYVLGAKETEIELQEDID